MTIDEQLRINSIKCQLKKKYPSLNDVDCERAFDLAVADYLIKKYPSENNRPTPETLLYDFVTVQCLYKILAYLSGASGIPVGVKEYSENSLKFVFDTSVLANYFDFGLPKAAIPK